MGNQPVSALPSFSSSWLSTNLQQLPGLIKTTWKQVTEELIPQETSNLPFQKLDSPILSYHKLIDGMSSPVAFVDPGDGSVFYIVDQIGFVYLYDHYLASKSDEVRVNPSKGTLYKKYAKGDNNSSSVPIIQPPLVDISGIITPLNPLYDERGLLSMVFHPTDKYKFYLYYTVPPTKESDKIHYNCEVILEEWQLHKTNLTDMKAKPTRTILRWLHDEANHFGSPIGFGPNGLLYLATGDGGGAGDKHGKIGNAQNISSPWGKIYVIDIDSQVIRITLYSLGFRNPFRGSFTLDGFPIVGDVGQDEWEGIVISKYGQNHGWRAVENGHIYDENLYNNLLSNKIKITSPALWYSRALGRAVIGGYQLNEKGDYIFGDFTGGLHGDNVYLVKDDILLIQPKTNDRYKFLHSFGKDRNGRIYGLFSNTMGINGTSGALYVITID